MSVPVLTFIDPPGGSINGGDAALITGSNLLTVISVYFGSNLATDLNVASDELILCTVPAGTEGQASVVAYSADGPSNSLTYEYSPPPPLPPVLTSITPSSGSTDGGEQVTISGSNFFNVISVYFGSNLATDLNVASDEIITCTVPAGTLGNVNVVAYIAEGPSNSLTYTYAAPYPCFTEDVKILTDKGYIPIQDLRKGDLVKTLKHDYKKIDMIGKRDIYHPAINDRIKDQLYQCSPSEYPQVFEPLVITGCHSILMDEFTCNEQREKTSKVLGDIYVTDKKYRVPACVDERASVYAIAGTYTIYHLALENDDYYMNYGIYANGLLVESCSKRYLTELSNMTLLE